MARDSLHQLYLTDHRGYMKGLERLKRCLAAGDPHAAWAAARSLDRLAGPLIAFERRCLYPMLDLEYGRELVEDLQQSREGARLVVGQLLHVEDPHSVTGGQLENWLALAEASLDHGFHAGTLLSHIDSLDQSDQLKLGRCLESFQRRRLRWTELPTATG